MGRCELIRFRTEDGVRLTGALFGVGHERRCVVHVHGSCGNFYEAEFVHVMAERYAAAGIALFSINLRTSNCISEGYGKGKDFRYVGGSLDDFSGCVEDIACAINAITHRGMEVAALQGHSLGCDRIIWYQLCRQETYPTILMAPCDSHALQVAYMAPERIEAQMVRLKSLLRLHSERPETHILPASEYGVSSPLENYHTPITAKALISIMEGPPFRLLRQDGSGEDWRLKSRACVFVGQNDNLQTSAPSKVHDFLKHRFDSVDMSVVQNCDHDFSGKEIEVASVALDWMKRE